MIELFTGSIGSGKSVHAIREVQKRTKRPVIMNFPLRKMRPNWVYRDNDELDVSWLIEFARAHSAERYGGRVREGMILLVIDEASMLWNARDYNAKGKGEFTRRWLRFFAQSRKLGFDVILVAQFDKQIDRQIRECVEYEVHHYSAKHMFPIKYLARLLPFTHVSLVLRTWYAAKGMKQRAPGLMISFPWHFAAYDSMRMFDAPEESVFRTILERPVGDQGGAELAAVAERPAAPEAGTESAAAARGSVGTGILARIAERQKAAVAS